MRHKVTAKKIADLTGMRRPLIADDAHTVKHWMIRSLPIVEHVIDCPIKTFLGWIPRFHQVVIDVDVIDGANGCVGVRVSSEQCPFGIWIKFNRLFQKLDARHARHSLIDEKERDRFVAELQLFHGFEGSNPGIRGDDLVTIAVLPPQVTFHGSQHVRIVVHCPNHWFWHNCLSRVHC